MAFDLRAILRLDVRDFTRSTDRARREMERMERQSRTWRDSQGRLRDEMGRYARQTDTASRSMSRFTQGASNLSGGVSKLIGTLGTLAGAYVGVQGAKNIFDSTVGSAATMEDSKVTISAMFDDKKLSKQYTDMLDKFSIKSPIMNSQDMYAHSKSFISTTKDVKQLEKMWGLTERMAAIDPLQGVEGSVFALRELLSGDATSMVERFEMPRKIMNDIKNLPIAEQLTALDKYFSKIGMTTKLIDERAKTTNGKWAQVSEQFQKTLREMGEPSLKVVTGFLNKVLDTLNDGKLDRFAKVGSKWIENTITGMTNGAIGLFNWFDNLTSSKEWKKKTTLSAKVNFIIGDLKSRFENWYEKQGGKKQLSDMATTLTKGLATFLEDNSPVIASAALKVGGSIGSSLASGIKTALDNDPIARMIFQTLTGAVIGGKVAGVPGAVIGGGTGVVNSGMNSFMDVVSPYVFGKWDKPKSQGGEYKSPLDYWGDLGNSHNGGLDYVPYDSYPASLHKGEKVLTRQQATEYRNGNGGGNTYHFGGITIQGGATDKESAKNIIKHLVKELETAGAGGA